VIRRKQENGDPDSGHCLAGFYNCPAVNLIGFENVASDNDELTFLPHRDLPEIPDRIKAGRSPARLGIGIEEAPGYAELPVARMKKADAHH